MTRAPQIAIGCGGRFVAFDVARALADRGALAGLVTAYPRALREGVPWRALHWNPWLGAREIAERRWSNTSGPRLDYDGAMRFGQWAARKLPDADIIQAWSGYALETLQAADARGIPSILLRGSAHIVAQRDLLEDEYRHLGMKADATHPQMIDRELAEYERAPVINVLSTFARNTFVKMGFAPERLVVTPLGVNVGAMSSAPRVPRNGPLRVLYLGTISAQKGVHYLLEAIQRLRGNATLTLAGGASPDGEALLRRFASGKEVRTKAARRQLPALFAQHDVIVLPSVQDGFGAVICEGMAAGLPAIATTHTGGPDVIVHGETGFVVPPRSVDALAEALGTLADDPHRCAGMGWAAARSIRAAHTWDHFVNGMIALYSANRGGSALACA